MCVGHVCRVPVLILPALHPPAYAINAALRTTRQELKKKTTSRRQNVVPPS